MDGFDLETLANLGDFISAIVVVVSLAYLAYQVRQNTESLRTENYARVLERVANMQARLSSDAVFAELIARGAADPTRLSASERVQFTWTFYEMFGAFEFMLHQTTSKALPEEVWLRWSETLAWWLSLPGVRTWWSATSGPVQREFHDLYRPQVAGGTQAPAMRRGAGARFSGRGCHRRRYPTRRTPELLLETITEPPCGCANALGTVSVPAAVR